MTRSWADLLSDDDAISLVRGWAVKAPFGVELLPADPASGRRALEALQVTTRSPLGAVALRTGGILIDHGWLRVLGSGCGRVPRAVDKWNGLGAARRCDKGLLVADDALGGFFAWFEEPRTVHYLAPDTLEWEDLEFGYSDWLQWCFSEGLSRFCKDLRWVGWEAEVGGLDGSRALQVVPPLFTSGQPIGERSRRAISVTELWDWALDIGGQLRGVGDGEVIKFTVPGGTSGEN